MSFSRPAWPARPAWPVSVSSEPLPPPEDPAAASPSSKRPRLKEPEGISETGWPLLVVPRLSEVEKVWEWSPRPITAFLIPKSLWSSGNSGRPRCDLGWQDRTFHRQSYWQSGISGRAGCSRAPGRFCEAGLQDREAVGVCHGGQAEVSHASPNTSMPGVQGVKQEPEELPVRKKKSILKEKNSVRQPGNPYLDVNISEETKSTLHDSVIISGKKENDVSSSTLKISKFQNQAQENANPSYIRNSVTIICPEFPKDLNSNMSFVYLKKIAKKKNDKIVAYVRDFTTIFCSQNRPDAKKQKLQDDKKNVFVENDFSDYESNHQSLTVKEKIDLINLNYYCRSHSSIECDVNDSKKNFSLTLEDENWEGTERSLDCYIPTRQEESQSWHCNSSILKSKKQNCLIMKKNKIICENTNKLRENLILVQLLVTNLLNKGDYYNVRAKKVHEQQSKTLIIGHLGTSSNLIQVVWFSGKGENANMLQLRYYTVQKYISGNKEDSALTRHKAIKCEKQIDIQKSGILSKYLQNIISKLLHIILKINTVSLPQNFDSFIRNGDYWKSEERCIFKCIVHLNYLKNIIKGSHIVYLTKMLISSRPLENNTKSMAKKRKLFKIKHALERAKKQNINSLTLTTKSFPSYKPCEEFSLLMDFDNMKGLYLTKEPSFENTSCPEQLLYVEESSMCNQYLDTDRKWKHKTTYFIFKLICDDAFNVRQLGTLLSQNTTHSDQMSATAITQKLSLENLLGETEEKIHDFILKKEMKVTKTSSSFQAQNAIDVEKEEDSSHPMDRMSSVQSASLASKSVYVEEDELVNQNIGAHTEEDGSILQESELINSKHFSPKNDSTLYANHQFERDSSEENNECFQGLTAKCLSTETLPIAKDFEMKSKFDLVLEELRMFHEISKENEIPRTVEMDNRKENNFSESNNVMEARMESGKTLEMVETNKRYEPSLPCHVEAGPDKHKRHQGLFNWKIIPTHGGQVVPNEYGCLRPAEELLHSIPEEDYKKTLPKSPAFSPDECKKEKYNYLSKGGGHFSHGISRVLPLKTCSRPIRVGLSRRARLKQLHPYLK
ncbi:RAD51-associated protein 2 [Acomys russatus]|uniref:RAD51-associated protein 2 n=1 Tax=Acomys russatus TaxID=60746 RepID=UPI0021E32064|nr:RAD51-associated protein 2 [Acomys russatus]